MSNLPRYFSSEDLFSLQQKRGKTLPFGKRLERKRCPFLPPSLEGCLFFLRFLVKGGTSPRRTPHFCLALVETLFPESFPSPKMAMRRISPPPAFTPEVSFQTQTFLKSSCLWGKYELSGWKSCLPFFPFFSLDSDGRASLSLQAVAFPTNKSAFSGTKSFPILLSFEGQDSVPPPSPSSTKKSMCTKEKCHSPLPSPFSRRRPPPPP